MLLFLMITTVHSNYTAVNKSDAYLQATTVDNLCWKISLCPCSMLEMLPQSIVRIFENRIGWGGGGFSTIEIKVATVDYMC